MLLSFAVAGCGRRGRLEPAPDPSNPFKLSYDQQTRKDATPADTGEKGKTGMKKRPKNPPITPPHDSFILDPLL